MTSRLASFRRRTGVLVGPLVLSLAAAAGIAVLPAGTTPAGAATPGVLTLLRLVSSASPATSSTHHKLILSVFAQTDPLETAENQLRVSLALPNGVEAHSWTFVLPTSALTASSTGAHLVMPSAKIEPFGRLSLTAKNVGASTTSVCGDDDDTVIQPVSLRGKLYFNTRSTGKHRWGWVGKKKGSISFATGKTGKAGTAGSVFYTSYGTGGLNCSDDSTPCVKGIGLTSLNRTDVIDAGVVDSHLLVSELRGTAFATPKGAERTDIVGVRATAKLSIGKAGPSGQPPLTFLTVTPVAGTAARGYIEVQTIGTYDTSTMDCERNGVDGTEQVRTWPQADLFKHTISFNEQVFGRLTYTKSLAAYFESYSG